jgi:hypothetical protein
LDINVGGSLKKFQTKLPKDTFLSRQGSSPTRLRVTFLHPTNAIKCDIASDRAAILPQLIKYTTVTPDGIRYALPNLLLADKLRTYGERSLQAEAKTVSDLLDIMHLLDVMWQKGDIIPEDLKQLIITENAVKVFWEKVPEGDRDILREPLAAVGIVIPQ